jgi:hypothetical protein
MHLRDTRLTMVRCTIDAPPREAQLTRVCTRRRHYLRNGVVPGGLVWSRHEDLFTLCCDEDLESCFYFQPIRVIQHHTLTMPGAVAVHLLADI